MINIKTIAQATRCPRADNGFYDTWDQIYKEEGKIEKLLYGQDFKLEYTNIGLIYRDLTPHAKVLQHVCSKTFLHKNSSRDHIIELGRFVIYHMLTSIPFNLPIFIYVNMMGCIKGMDGYNFWNYNLCLISRIMQHQGMIFHLMSSSISTQTRNDILVNGVVRSHKFNVRNLKQVKLEV